MSQPFSPETVRGYVEGALGAARAAQVQAPTKRELHAARSRRFVAELGQQLRALYSSDPTIRVFTKHDPSNRDDFGMNEMLYDVTACRTATVSSATGRKRLRYISAPIWHIESELAHDSGQAIFDFNKLVLGAAPLNLFVGPLAIDPQAFINVLRAPAACCQGRVFVALIPHPRDWAFGASGVVCSEIGKTAEESPISSDGTDPCQ